MEEVLALEGLHLPDDQVGAICVGFGFSEPRSPSPTFFLEFLGQDPPVAAFSVCRRIVHPETSLPLIQTEGGERGLLVLIEQLGTSGRGAVQVRIEKTDSEARLAACEMAVPIAAQRREVGRRIDPSGQPVGRRPVSRSGGSTPALVRCRWVDGETG
jgi:hypothetical protein